jgi:hypothetical protein
MVEYGSCGFIRNMHRLTKLALAVTVVNSTKKWFYLYENAEPSFHWLGCSVFC